MFKQESNNSFIGEHFVKEKSVDHLPSSITSETIGQNSDIVFTKVEPDVASESDNVDCDKSIAEDNKSVCMLQNAPYSRSNFPTSMKIEVEGDDPSVITRSERQMNKNFTDLSLPLETEVKNALFPSTNTFQTSNTTVFSLPTFNSRKFSQGSAVVTTSQFTAASSPSFCASTTAEVSWYRSDVTASTTNTSPFYSFFKFSKASKTPASTFTSANLFSFASVDSNSPAKTSSNCVPTPSHFSLGNIFSPSFKKRPFSETLRITVSSASSTDNHLPIAYSTSTSLACASTSSSVYFSSGIATPIATTSSVSAVLSPVSSAIGTDKFSFRNANSTAVTTTTPFVTMSSPVSTSSSRNVFIYRNSSWSRKARQSAYSHDQPRKRYQKGTVKGSVSKNNNSVKAHMDRTGTFDFNTKCLACSSPCFSNSLCNLESLSQDLGNLLDKKLAPDVQFNCNGQTFLAHKIILVARSNVFATMFEKETAQSNTEEIPFSELSPEALGIFLKYLYTGKLPADVLEDVVCEVYAASHKYEVSSLSKVCSDLIIKRLTKGNYLKMLKLSNACNDDKLMEAISCFVTKELLTSDDWVKFSHEQPSLAVKIYQMYIKNSISNRECCSPRLKFPRKQ